MAANDEFDQLVARAGDIARILRRRKETIAVSESTAGGLISAALLAVPGASHYYRGGGVVYTHRAMRRILEIDLKQHEGIRSSSEPYAELAAKAIRERFGASWGLAETGAAGPGGNSYGDASGHTCIAVDGGVDHVMTLETGMDDRVKNMWRFAGEGLAVMLAVLAAAEQDAGGPD